MKNWFILFTFIFSIQAAADGSASMCLGLFTELKTEVGILSPSKNYEAFLSEDMRVLKIIHRKNKTEYVYESNDILNGAFSLDGHAWIIRKFDEVLIWNFDRVEGNLIRVKLKHPLSFPETEMRKDPATGHTILEISYSRKKIDPDNNHFDTVKETILKDLETFIESRF